MKQDASNSADNSAAISPDDAELLAVEAAAARAAILRQLDEIKARLDPVDNLHGALDGALRKHPWLTTVAACAAGFLVAKVAFAAREPSRTSSRSQVGSVEPPREAAASPPWWSLLIGPLVEIFKTTIEKLLLDLLSRPRATAQPADDAAPSRSSTGNRGS